MAPHRMVRFAAWLGHRLGVLTGSAMLTIALFLVLPLMQTISKPPDADTLLQQVDTVALPPPPPPQIDEPEPEPEPQEEPPKLIEEAPPLDLSQLELALNPGLGGDFGSGDFSIQLGGGESDGSEVDALFSLADLDQKPRAIYQPGPIIDARMRKQAPGAVNVLFMVDIHGRVQNPMVQSSTDPVFERAALAAVKKWRFEPGQRKGQPVGFRMRQSFTFPAER